MDKLKESEMFAQLFEGAAEIMNNIKKQNPNATPEQLQALYTKAGVTPEKQQKVAQQGDYKAAADLGKEATSEEDKQYLQQQKQNLDKKAQMVGAKAAKAPAAPAENTPADNSGNNDEKPVENSEAPAEQVTPQASTIDEIKEFVGKNADITDWPKEQLDKLVGYLNTLDEFKNSKKAQAAIKAIQQAETENGEGGGEKPAEAGAEGTGADQKTEAPAEEKSNAPVGNAVNVPEGDLTTVISRLTNLGNTYTVDDLAAALKAKGKK